jgi:hypothetical protein
MPLKLVPKIEGGRQPENSFYEARITLIPNWTKIQQRKKL